MFSTRNFETQNTLVMSSALFAPLVVMLVGTSECGVKGMWPVCGVGVADCHGLYVKATMRSSAAELRYVRFLHSPLEQTRTL